MVWVRLDDQIADHPKFRAAGPQAAWLWVCGVTYASRYLTDGFLSAAQVRTLGGVRNSAKLAEQLVAVGLWETVEGGFQIHDYHDYQPTSEEVKKEREEARIRQQKLRMSRRTNSVTATDVTPDARAGAHVRACAPVPAPATPARPGPARPTKTTPERESRGVKRTPADAGDPPAQTNGHGHWPLNAPKGVNLTNLLEEFRSVGLPRPTLSAGEVKHASALLQEFPAELLARCWQDYASGEFGDDFDRRNLSFAYLARNNRVANWQRETNGRLTDDELVGEIEVVVAHAEPG